MKVQIEAGTNLTSYGVGVLEEAARLSSLDAAYDRVRLSFGEGFDVVLGGHHIAVVDSYSKNRVAMIAHEDENEKYKVAEFRSETSRTRVYILNPGDFFSGFGGSSRGLVVRKTASLIIRRESPSSVLEDTEYDVNSKNAWAHIFTLAKAG